MARPKRICSIPDCGKAHSGHGYCLDHYNRWKRYGDPTAGVIPRWTALRFYQDTVLAYDGDECLIWPFSTTRGYGQLRYEGRPQIVSRLVCMEAHGEPPDETYQAAHSCGKGNLGCVAKRHLSWKTQSENEADKKEHGTDNRRGGAKLSVREVIAIRRLKELTGLANSTIATSFGVDRRAVDKIISRETWTQV